MTRPRRGKRGRLPSDGLFLVSCRHVTGFVPHVCRWYQATKSTNQAMAAKVDSLKDEKEEALNKVEICKVGVASKP